MQSRNAQVINEDQLVCYAYEKLLTAKIFGDVDLEGAAMRTLLDLGEHQAEYQQVLTGRFVIPDLERIRRDAPKVVLYVSGLEKVGYQANMWIPVLERLSVKSAIVIREKHIAEELIPTVLPIYFMRTMRDVENLEQANVRTILYPANTQKNIHTLRFYRMNHYFINHGESDKVVNQSKFLMAYDKLLVGGEMAERRLKDANLPLREGQVVHVGRPQAELMLEKLDQPTKKLKLCCMLQPGKGLLRKPITHP
ncbi:CDP-glycerol:poly(glycerophosphate) glycerophosphotransferase [Ectothiorhodospira sp. PHS-1]|nr:CDP-glycerol:poly(glycerophosphate) glycerophosphotransferase [Ectothiorhodospira sp. PHS-1]